MKATLIETTISIKEIFLNVSISVFHCHVNISVNVLKIQGFKTVNQSIRLFSYNDIVRYIIYAFLFLSPIVIVLESNRCWGTNSPVGSFVCMIDSVP